MFLRITLLIFQAVFLFNCLDAQIEQFLFENRVHDIISQKDKISSDPNFLVQLSHAYYLTGEIDSAEKTMSECAKAFPNELSKSDSIYWLSLLKSLKKDSLFYAVLASAEFDYILGSPAHPEAFSNFDTVIHNKFVSPNKNKYHTYGLLETNEGNQYFTSINPNNKKSQTFGKPHFGIQTISNNSLGVFYNDISTSSEISYISDDQSYCLISKMSGKPSADGTKNIQSIYVQLVDGNVTEREILLPINSDDYSVSHPYYDVKNHILYFASNMKGGFGDVDIYCVKVDSVNSNGFFISEDPKNLGDKINTPGKESFPFVDENGTLFFASNGHGGFGGLDILFSEDNLNIKSLKEPFNSNKDDFFYRFSNNKGSYSSNRNGLDEVFIFNGIDYPEPEIVPDSLDISLTLDVNNESEKVSQLIYLIKVVDGIEIKVDSAFTNSKGKVEFKRLKETGVSYRLSLRTKPCGSLLDTKTGTIANDSNIVMKPNQLILGENIAQMIGIQQINYELGSYRITEESEVLLQKLVDFLKLYPQLELQLTSHTDSRGSSSFNQKLSQNRANSVLKFLVDNGISQKRLESKGFGESRLLNDCRDGIVCSEEEHSVNRRTEFIVTRITPCNN